MNVSFGIQFNFMHSSLFSNLILSPSFSHPIDPLSPYNSFSPSLFLLLSLPIDRHIARSVLHCACLTLINTDNCLLSLFAKYSLSLSMNPLTTLSLGFPVLMTKGNGFSLFLAIDWRGSDRLTCVNMVHSCCVELFPRG